MLAVSFANSNLKYRPVKPATHITETLKKPIVCRACEESSTAEEEEGEEGEQSSPAGRRKSLI